MPNAAWCGDVVGIRLEGAPEVFTHDPVFLQKFVAGTRAAVTAECPQALRIRFHAAAGGRFLYRSWTSRDGNWTICDLTDAPAATLPVLREIARVEAGRLNALAGARQVKYASEAQAGAAHAAWSISNVSLGLTIAEIDRAHAIALSDQVAQITVEAEKFCGSPEALGAEGAQAKATRRAFLCRQAAMPYAWGLLAWESGEHRFMLALWSPGADRDKGANLAAVATAFEKIVAGDW